jgi:hypothetical protein
LDIVLQSVLLVVLAPLVEETLFRGILLNRWATKWGIKRAIAVSALTFAILHVDLIGAFVFGVCMSLLYLRTSSLWPPIIVHASYNAMVTAVMLIGAGRQSTPDNPDLSAPSPWSGTIFVVLGAPFVIAFIYRNWPSPNAFAPYNAGGQVSSSAELPEGGGGVSATVSE